ncbi:hypothetical protein ASPZODRAFT_134439 [Penicilliopsis zonata CBS 506.65]|uniref:Rab-GAP TBC domain-containing protein n=1 Tax=Penicilliopsis zonata CBS 506.65 TaxID=1073090 RepID=A0A1L9SCV7_9EURO|nr:hypothetical protein ASPZODRAFT_134439 [Penicilliopsis zonata CBS 506.65]OJJ45006.1 hypothetical protein ASPZODRAFT_134439 [Penicilliopsis zonata CBS 506.65]
MAELDLPPQRRSSSQTSSSSRRSAHRTKPRPQKRHSASSNATTTDLTSFPSLSPDRSPEGFFGQPALNSALANALLEEEDDGDDNTSVAAGVAGAVVGGGGAGGTSSTSTAEDSGSEVARGRRVTLARLTTTRPSASGRAALFDDVVTPRDMPGALHLADDAHIQRLLASTGPVKLVRQFARDLALRDAEISALRQRADARERELKRMLREVAVSHQDIERRLYALENSRTDHSNKSSAGEHGDASEGIPDRHHRHSGINGLMKQAMADEVGSAGSQMIYDDSDPQQATIRAQQRLVDGDPRSRTSSVDSRAKRQGSIRGWGDYLFGSVSASRKTSRASSVKSDAGDADEYQRYSRQSGNRRKALDDQLFQPPPQDGLTAGDAAKERLAKATNGDDASIHSRKSSRSFTSWTVKLFAGGSSSSQQGSKDDTIRSRASSTGQNGDSNTNTTTNKPATLSANSKSGLSAIAALKRINSSASIHSKPTSGGPAAVSSGAATRGNTPGNRRVTASSVSQPGSGGTETVPKNPTNLGPVEMDAILPMESRPPTLNVYNSSVHQFGELLTDRFGFIYDQRRKRRQREAAVNRTPAHRLSVAETLSTFRGETPDGDEDDLNLKMPITTVVAVGTSNTDDPDNNTAPPKRWQDYLKISTRATELLSHTPSAGPIVSLTTSGEGGTPRGVLGVAVDKGGTVSVNPTGPPPASTSTVVADNPEFAGISSEEPATIAPTSTTIFSTNSSEQEPVRLLLEQLTELHDALQRERTVRWNEFLRKVRAERRKEGEAAAAAAAASDRPLPRSIDMPEVSLADGEMVGISGLGNKGKVGRAKWREFRMLVLGGIPVALRAKIWSECSGASAMRIPGYYEELVRGETGAEPDGSVRAQIDMDIYRTLTDNVFFRKGPGVAKLQEVLLAYSRRNPEVGYCQGMNLIAASLLLITPTAEDAFWLLASMIEVILPQHYYDHGLLASRADQVVLRQYIAQVLPRLSAHLDSLGIELEALTFQWFLSVFTDCLSAEALYRVWDVVFCLNASTVADSASTTTTAAPAPATTTTTTTTTTTSTPAPTTTNTPATPTPTATATVAATTDASGSGGSIFLFQVALALLKLNEQQLLTSCSTPAALYTYINHQMTNHAISIDGLIQASEALRNVVRREEVIARRAVALHEMQS